MKTSKHIHIDNPTGWVQDVYRLQSTTGWSFSKIGLAMGYAQGATITGVIRLGSVPTGGKLQKLDELVAKHCPKVVAPSRPTAHPAGATVAAAELGGQLLMSLPGVESNSAPSGPVAKAAAHLAEAHGLLLKALEGCPPYASKGLGEAVGGLVAVGELLGWAPAAR